MGMKWLITGGCGFIGTSLIHRLQKENSDHEIRVLDNLSVGTREDLGNVCNFVEVIPESFIPSSMATRVELVIGDILDEELAQQVSKGVDVIVHLAANTGVGPSVENPRIDCFTNVIGTFNYLEAARKQNVHRFIFASSGAPAGNVEPPIHEELPPHPVSPYGASKLAGEGYCSAYYQTFGINTISLRFGNVYGPGSVHKNSVVAKFISRALNGEPLEIYGDGSQTRDFIYIDDLVEAILLCSSVENIGGEVFQIATNQETTIGEMAQRLVEVLKDKGLKEGAIKCIEQRIGDVKRNYSDTTKARTVLGWQSKTELRIGIENTILYFLNNQK